MWNVSNYYQQAQGLQVVHPSQLPTLKTVDVVTRLREISKIGTLIGLVSAASNVVFNFDPTPSLHYTLLFGTFWLITGMGSELVEPYAITLIQHLQEIRDKK